MIKRGMICILVIVMVLSTVSIATAATYAPAAAPVINSFTASSTSVAAGDTVILKWDVSGAQSIEILGLEKTPEGLPLKGEMEVWPLATTTYVLNAYGQGGTMTTKTITVNVGTAQGPVKIEYFTATPTKVQPGETSTLKFKITNVKSYEIVGLEKLPECYPSVPTVEESVEVWPLATTSYVLMAYGFKGESASAVVTVTVESAKKVAINSFTVSPSQIQQGASATLSWNVSNASNIKIEGVKDNLAASGTLSVSPTATREYKLIATGVSGDTATATVVVTVAAANNVKILTFTADKTTVSRGTLVKLSWTTQNATGCTILTSDGLKLTNRPANGSISITPNATRTYTLVAYNASQQTVEKSITITVN